MKKLVTLVTMVLSILAVMATMANASAVEFIGNNNTNVENIAISVELPLAKDGRICGLRSLSEKPAEGTIALTQKASTVNGINADGTVLRHKAVKAITVADGTIADGLSQVQFNRFIAIEEDIKQNVLAETLVAVQQNDGSWVAFCRMTVSGKGTPIAKYYLANGLSILVVEYDWDNDGELEYCLVAGGAAVQNNGSQGQQKPTQSPAPQKPTPTPVPEKTEPNPEHQPIRIPSTLEDFFEEVQQESSGSTSDKANEPNPQHQSIQIPPSLADFMD